MGKGIIHKQYVILFVDTFKINLLDLFIIFMINGFVIWFRVLFLYFLQNIQVRKNGCRGLHIQSKMS